MQRHGRVDQGAWSAVGRESRRNPADFLARLMGIYIVCAVGRLADFVPGIHDVPIAKLLAAAAIVSAMRNPVLPGAATWRSVPPAKLTLAVMGLATLSMLWSVLRSATFGVISGTVLAVTVTMILVIRASRAWAPVKTILRGGVLAAMVLCATVFTSRVLDSGGYRAGYSSSYDPNDFAFVLNGLLPLVVTFGIVSGGARRLLYFATAGVVTLAILLTQSRGGFLGLIVNVLGMAFYLPVSKDGRLRFRLTTSGILLRAVILVVIGAIAWQSLPENARARLGTITELGSDYNSNLSNGALTDPNAGRLAIWMRNLPLIVDRPWGFGAGSFEIVDGRFAHGRFRAPHNTLLQALMELGIQGFALFIATIVASLRYLRVPKTQDRASAMSLAEEEPLAFARALRIGWMGLCLTGFFLSELYSNMFWTYVTLSCAVGIALRMPAATAGEPTLEGGADPATPGLEPPLAPGRP